mgnify:CR=1 FL=1
MSNQITLEAAQAQVDQWIKTIGVNYFSELTNLGVLMEEVGELSRLMVRKYGDQSFKNKEASADMGDEMADVLFVLICLANQTGIDLNDALTKNLEKKTRYITVAYLTHLIHHHANIPIIDQHNFRAMNDLLNKAQGSSFSKKKPSNWNDILVLKNFMLSLQEYLPQYSFAELDRFLMMFGRYHAVR